MENEKAQYPNINDPKRPIKLSELSVGDFFTIDGIFVCRCTAKLDDIIIYLDNIDEYKKTATYTHKDNIGVVWPRWCEIYYNQDESLTA